MQVSAVMLKTISGVAAASRRLAGAGHFKQGKAERAHHHSNGSSHSLSGALLAHPPPFITHTCTHDAVLAVHVQSAVLQVGAATDIAVSQHVVALVA